MFKLTCEHYRTSRAKNKTFEDNKLLQSHTFIQDAHSTSSVKNKSRSKSKKLANSSRTNKNHMNKIKVPRPSSKEETCPFCITLVLSKKQINGI